MDKTVVLSRLAAFLARADHSSPLAARLCLASVELLAADGGVITFSYDTEARVTIYATDPAISRIEDLQDVTREGPGWDANRDGGPVTARLDHLVERWPTLDQAIQAHDSNPSNEPPPAAGHDRPLPAVLYAVPIRTRGEAMGVLTLYRRQVDQRALDLEGAQFLADAIGAALLKENDWQGDDPSGPWSGRARVHQATGMVMAQLNIRADDAVALLRAHAYSHATTLEVTAAEIVNRRLDFTRTDNPLGDP